MSDLFVSYSRDDYEFVEKFYKAIQLTGRKAWIDCFDIPKGKKFWDEITEEIDGADIFVFIMSPSSVERASRDGSDAWCWREIEYAAKQNKRIIPIVYREGFTLNKNILTNKILSERNWMVFNDPSKFDNSLQELIKAIDSDLPNIKKHAELTIAAKKLEQHGRRDKSAPLRAISKSLESNTLTLHRYCRTNKSYTEDLGDGVKLTLMLILAGEFLMGAPEDEPGSQGNERPQHSVEVPQFLMGRSPITQVQWRVVAGYPQIERELNPDPSRFKGNNHPVEKVRWDDAQEFCQRLSAQTGKEYRLPSEAQWEYCCRAGTTTPFHYGETITSEIANYRGIKIYNNGPKGEYREQTVEVGMLPANEWGLHDMHGNVWEWCEDDWHSDYEGAPNDGSAWVETDRKSMSRLLRGGSWYNDPVVCRSSFRDYVSLVNRVNDIGFRVCCVPPRTSS